MALAFAFSFSSTAQATALLVCSGADGVVVSADSRGHSLKGEVEDYDKLQLVGERVVVAEAGLLTIRDRRGPLFDVHDFVADATRRLGARPTVAATSHALAAAARHKLRALVDHPSVTRAERPQVILLVAGFDDKPGVFRVVVELKPFSVSEVEQGEAMVAVGLGSGHLEPDGPLLQLAARRRRPKVQDGGSRIETAADDSLAARADWCGLLLTVEAELNPTVAPPIRQALVPASGAAQRRLYPKAD